MTDADMVAMFENGAVARFTDRAIVEAARNLDRLRRVWLEPEDADEQILKTRTLTNLYNRRPALALGGSVEFDSRCRERCTE